SRRRHTRFSRDWSSDVCSSDLCHKCRKSEPFSFFVPSRQLTKEAIETSARAPISFTLGTLLGDERRSYSPMTAISSISLLTGNQDRKASCREGVLVSTVVVPII